jgi:hypothetical protein
MAPRRVALHSLTFFNHTFYIILSSLGRLRGLQHCIGHDVCAWCLSLTAEDLAGRRLAFVNCGLGPPKAMVNYECSYCKREILRPDKNPAARRVVGEEPDQQPYFSFHPANAVSSFTMQNSQDEEGSGFFLITWFRRIWGLFCKLVSSAVGWIRGVGVGKERDLLDQGEDKGEHTNVHLPCAYADHRF